jgi:hypothetical protein
MLWAFRHLRLIGGFSSKAEREWPNTEAARTPTATKMMYIAIGTRPFRFPLWSGSYNKSYFNRPDKSKRFLGTPTKTSMLSRTPIRTAHTISLVEWPYGNKESVAFGWMTGYG